MILVIAVAVIGVVWFVLTGARWLDRWEDEREREFFATAKRGEVDVRVDNDATKAGLNDRLTFSEGRDGNGIHASRPSHSVHKL